MNENNQITYEIQFKISERQDSSYLNSSVDINSNYNQIIFEGLILLLFEKYVERLKQEADIFNNKEIFAHDIHLLKIKDNVTYELYNITNRSIQIYAPLN